MLTLNMHHMLVHRYNGHFSVMHGPVSCDTTSVSKAIHAVRLPASQSNITSVPRIHPTCKSEKQTSILYNATVNSFLVLDHIPAIHVRIQQVLVTAWKCFLPSNLQFTCKDFHLTTKFWHNTTLCVNNSTHLLSSETTGYFILQVSCKLCRDYEPISGYARESHFLNQLKHVQIFLCKVS